VKCGEFLVLSGRRTLHADSEKRPGEAAHLLALDLKRREGGSVGRASDSGSEGDQRGREGERERTEGEKSKGSLILKDITFGVWNVKDISRDINSVRYLNRHHFAHPVILL
jgi:hypothetical protein